MNNEEIGSMVMSALWFMNNKTPSVEQYNKIIRSMGLLLTQEGLSDMARGWIEMTINEAIARRELTIQKMTLSN